MQARNFLQNFYPYGTVKPIAATRSKVSQQIVLIKSDGRGRKRKGA